MDIDRFVLNKLTGGAQDCQHMSNLDLGICFMIDKLGYMETMNLPLPVFMQMIDYYKFVAEKEKEATKK